MLIYSCPKCGSHNCTIDAVAKWDVAAQSFVLCSVQDYMTCQECDYEADKGFLVKPVDLTAAGLQYVLPGTEAT